MKISLTRTVPFVFVDAFVEKLELDKLGFKLTTLKTEGRPSYQTSLFLKIYIYGYLNGMRSSRKLEKECIRNIELQWLCGKNYEDQYALYRKRQELNEHIFGTIKRVWGYYYTNLRFEKSKWRMEFDHDCLQYETRNEHSWNRRFTQKITRLEAKVSKGLAKSF